MDIYDENQGKAAYHYFSDGSFNFRDTYLSINEGNNLKLDTLQKR